MCESEKSRKKTGSLAMTKMWPRSDYNTRKLETVCHWQSPRHESRNTLIRWRPSEYFLLCPHTLKPLNWTSCVPHGRRCNRLQMSTFFIPEKFEHMKSTGDYYVIVVEDTNVGQIVATATLITEHKFIHSCAKVHCPPWAVLIDQRPRLLLYN